MDRASRQGAIVIAITMAPTSNAASAHKTPSGAIDPLLQALAIRIARNASLDARGVMRQRIK